MPLNAMLIPTECAPTVDEIKRALLSFDEVHLLSPDDRELIPPVAFMPASTAGIGFPIPFAVDTGFVLPLPKVKTYDSEFEQVIEAVDKAGAAQSLIVKPTPTFESGAFLGAVPIPEGWPNPVWTFQVFRQLASSPDYLRAAARSFPNWQQRLPELEELRPDGQGFFLGNTLPPFGTAGLGEGAARDLIDRLAAARLSAVVKTFGMCTVQGLHPFTTDPGAEAVLGLVANAAMAVPDGEEGRDEQLGLYVSLTQRVLLQEVLSTSVLRDMSVKDVVRLRTKAWGKALEARARFLRQISTMAGEAKTIEEFERRVESEANSYLRARSDLGNDWARLGAKVTLDVGGKALVTAGAGTLVQKVLAINLDNALTIAGIVAIGAAEYVDDVWNAIKGARAAHETAGAALLSPYRFLF